MHSYERIFPAAPASAIFVFSKLARIDHMHVDHAQVVHDDFVHKDRVLCKEGRGLGGCAFFGGSTQADQAPFPTDG